MPTVNIEGMGNIEFPDGMSEEDMTNAINSHPDYQALQAQKSDKSGPGLLDRIDNYDIRNAPSDIRGALDTVDNYDTRNAPKDISGGMSSIDNYDINKGLTNIFGPINEYIKSHNVLGLQSSQNFQHEANKGIPILNSLLPKDTQENLEFQKNNPNISRIAPMIGGAISTIPIAAGVGELAGASALGQGSSLISKAINLAKNPISQGAAFAGVNAADAYAAGKSPEEIKRAAVLGAAGGAAGPFVGKALSPGVKISEGMAKTLGYGAGALGGGITLGMPEAILGALAGETGGVTKGIQALVGNKIFNNPKAMAILQSLMGTAPQNIPESMFRGGVYNKLKNRGEEAVSRIRSAIPSTE